MKQCGVYEILKYIVNGGFIVFVSNAKKYEIKLISHNGGECVGHVSEKTFYELCNSGVIVADKSSTDKYGAKYTTYTLINKQKETLD